MKKGSRMTAWIITALICTTAILSETACLALAESVQGNTAEHIANLLNRDEYVSGEALALVTENGISGQDGRMWRLRRSAGAVSRRR